MRIFFLAFFVFFGANLIHDSVKFATNIQEQKVSQLTALYNIK